MHNKVELSGTYGDDEIIALSAWTSTSRDLDDEKRKRIPALIKRLWNDGHECYDDSTEILTKRGWILFKDLTDSDVVATVTSDGKECFFEKPSRIVNYDYNDLMYYVKSSQLDIAVTKNHKMFVSQKRKADGSDYGINYEIQTSDDVYGKSRKYLISSLINNKDTLDSNFAKLVGFFIGDGHATSSTRISFHLKKDRKIKFLKSLGFYIEDKSNNSFVINGTNFDFTKCYDSDGKKIIPFDIYNLSHQDVSNILEGLKMSDGHEKDRGYGEYCFSNTSMPLINQLSILAPLHGFSFNLHKKYLNVQRTLFSNRITPEISNMESRKLGRDYWKMYNGKVYCVTVSTGLIIVRRNNKPVICGNTPFEKGTVHFLVTTDIASHIHLLKHRISSLNAESARYKELREDKYYVPSDWPEVWQNKLIEYTERGNELYHEAIKELEPHIGRARAKESARFFKTYNSQITADVMFNMRSFANFLNLRMSMNAQQEIREIAFEMLELVRDTGKFEHTLEAWGYVGKSLPPNDNNG